MTGTLHMAAHPALDPALDPRPRLVASAAGMLVAGVRCTACAHPVAFVRPRCPDCRAAVVPATFGPEGTVWSATVVRIPVPGRRPPFALAYVDLDAGPRVLATAPGEHALPMGTRVRLTDPGSGDVGVEVV